MESDFQRLIAAIRQGDRQSANELARKIEPYLRSAIRMRLTDSSKLRRVLDSSDLLPVGPRRPSHGQGGSAWSGRETEDHIRAKILKMASNKLISKARHERRNRGSLPDGWERLDGAPSPSQAVADLDLKTAIWNRLSDEERWLFNQNKVQGRTWAEIALDSSDLPEALRGAGPDALRMRLTRAIARVKRGIRMGTVTAMPDGVVPTTAKHLGRMITTQVIRDRKAMKRLPETPAISSLGDGSRHRAVARRTLGRSPPSMAAWGGRMTAQAYLERHPMIAEHGDAAAALVYQEFVVRQELGESVEFAGYLQQFAEYGPELELLHEADHWLDDLPVPARPQRMGRINDYSVLERIAHGGMGVVYKGRDPHLGRELAIKVLLETHCDRPEMARRFIEEAQIGGQLQPPGIVPVYELG